MKVECINSTNFQGQIIKIGTNFSKKPQQCLAEAEIPLNNLIKTKPFDLYIHQDYSKNEIVFETDLVGNSKRIPITAKSSKYIETAKSTIEEYEKIEHTAKEEEWMKKQYKADLKDSCMAVLYFAVLPFIYMAETVKEGLKDFKTTFNKIAKKVAIKKG